jgi:DNA-binding NtrC family response regulator
LRATLHRATLLSDGTHEISEKNVSDAFNHVQRTPQASAALEDVWEVLDPVLAQSDMTIDGLTKLLYRRMVEVSDGNLSAAARKLGLSRAQLAYRLRSEL